MHNIENSKLTRLTIQEFFKHVDVCEKMAVCSENHDMEIIFQDKEGKIEKFLEPDPEVIGYLQYISFMQTISNMAAYASIYPEKTKFKSCGELSY